MLGLLFFVRHTPSKKLCWETSRCQSVSIDMGSRDETADIYTDLELEDLAGDANSKNNNHKNNSNFKSLKEKKILALTF